MPPATSSMPMAVLDSTVWAARVCFPPAVIASPRKARGDAGSWIASPALRPPRDDAADGPARARHALPEQPPPPAPAALHPRRTGRARRDRKRVVSGTSVSYHVDLGALRKITKQ